MEEKGRGLCPGFKSEPGFGLTGV